ncbi:MAG: DUF721 domain-containing protein [Bacteroidales bacterium]|nr:DUF721 domain-containing protein [Bacteroidales bacterium]MCF8344473.1 DUF721 domain-containing protein [Bacteroidales bacterium]MCF8350386.1 DUF721 domain-containing protein [Bacteroidales bacterium]MCF8375303.1 DUF721 domain-containing protein [Bacteroidales bacterium]MCF8400159.1 DUF721 domain-containing protein [Bacteroidales bacterium]
MIRSNEQSLGDAIKAFLKEHRLEKKLDETRLIHSWENIVGDMIARHTRSIYIRNKTLFVKLDSPALANELSYAREKIVKSLNKEIGKEVIADVKFSGL